MSQKKNVREAALNLLETIEKNQSYSNLLLNNVIKKENISKKDVGLLTELTYGTLQRRMTLDFYLEPFIQKARKLENWVRILLRLTLYQMVYLDKIPERAAIYEGVEIAKRRGHKGIASMVNGVLRSVQREGLPSLDAINDPIEKLAISTSHPQWLVEKWVKQLGFDKAKAMCETNLTAPLQTARVNVTKINREECLKLLQEEGFNVEASTILPEAIKCLRGNLAHSKAFQQGLITIQDESSMIVAHALGVERDETILDACAAPGGKSTHIAEKLDKSGQVISLDLHEHKVKLIQENAERLGLENIQARAHDSRKVEELFEKESFDRILLDAPCSGFGVMRRKPDMKYTKKAEDVAQLHPIQLKLLQAVAPLLKKGGTLVYSTCTVDEEENEKVIGAFLKEHPEFKGDAELKGRLPEAVGSLVNEYMLQILPQDFGSDGFFIASIRRTSR